MTDKPPAKPKLMHLDMMRPLIVCQGGPRDGMWYWADDFPRMTHSGSYRGTEQYREHPRVENKMARVIVWVPEEATQR